MLNTFEIRTASLTDQEKNLLPVVIRGLNKKRGVTKAVTNRDICKGLQRTQKIEISESRMKKIIDHIRLKNLVPGLIATPKGYYVSVNPHEVKQYIKSLEAKKNVIEGMTREFRNYLFEITTIEQKTIF